MVLTPVLVLLDFRSPLGFWTRTEFFTPYAENNNQVTSFSEVFGLTQTMWLCAGAATFVVTPFRQLVRQTSFLCLCGVLVLLWLVTAARTGIDQTTVHAVLTVLGPLVAATLLLTNANLTTWSIRAMVTAWVIAVSGFVAATLVLRLHTGQLGQRFDVSILGSPTYTGAVLAATLPLVFAAYGSNWFRLALGVSLGLGLVLTQTRGAVLGLGVACVVLAAWLPYARWIIIGGFGVAIAAFLGFGVRPLFTLSDPSDTLRRADLSRHWALFLRRPWFGYGLARSTLTDGITDNSLLEVLDRAGVVAFGLWLVAWLQPLVRAMRLGGRRQAVAPAAASLLATVGTWVTTGNQVLNYVPPTSFLPPLLAVALLTSTSVSPSGP